MDTWMRGSRSDPKDLDPGSVYINTENFKKNQKGCGEQPAGHRK